MGSPITALEIDGRVLGAPSLIAGTLLGGRSPWALVLRSEWDSDLCDRIRREGVLRDATVCVTVRRGAFEGRAWLEFEGDVEDGVVRVVALGLDELKVQHRIPY